ncbi:acetyltransferase [Sphingomonas faeni]|uniref:PglD-related sugar-binding protein n=1 Tax=Sphingomonas faeni TaxID=185950 RepID=UPI00334969F0
MRIAIYGAGGFGREMRRHVMRDTERLGYDAPVFASDDADQIGGTLLGLPIISSADLTADDRCVLAVGNYRHRRKMAERCAGFHTIVADTAIVDDGIAFAEGSVICDYTIFTADDRTVIGKHFHCNFQSYVGHDCVIGDFVTFGPRVGLNGNVHVGNDVYIGSGVLVKNGTPDRPIIIGDGATIGFGSVVTKDVPPGALILGHAATERRADLRAAS